MINEVVFFSGYREMVQSETQLKTLKKIKIILDKLLIKISELLVFS